jgi:hypothetical protein
MYYFQGGISENFCLFTVGSLRLGFNTTGFCNRSSVDLPGGKGTNCVAPRSPCLPCNDAVIAARELNVFYQTLSGENNNSRYLADDDILLLWRAVRIY